VSSSPSTVTLTKDNFNEVVGPDKTVIIDFWAAWCGPCRMFAPTFEAAAAENPDVVFAKVDTEDQPELAGHFGIQSIPTLMVFRERVGLFKQAGALPRAALDDLVRQVRALNMDEVRAEIAAEQASGG
jgi:thioredoxin 1